MARHVLPLVLFLSIPACADPADEPEAPYDLYDDVAKADGLYLVAGVHVDDAAGERTPILARSTDGTTWQVDEHPELPYRLDSMVFGNGRWVAVASNEVLWSDDLQDWSGNYGASSLWGVAYGNGIFVVSSSLGVAISVDGETWTEVAGAPDVQGYGVAFVGDRFLVPGRDALSNPGVYQSFDGATWTDAGGGGGESSWSAGPGGQPRIVGISVEYYGDDDGDFGVGGVQLGDDDAWRGFAIELPVESLACGDVAAFGVVPQMGMVRAVGAPEAWEWEVVLPGSGIGGDLLADGAEVIHAGDGIQRSVDDGVTWTEVL